MTADGHDTYIFYEARGKRFEVPISRLSLCGFGRAPSNTVVLGDSQASREHALIRRNAAGHCILSDLGSTNGTKVNGRLVQAPTVLASGDVIGIGSQAISFVQTAAPAQPEAEDHGYGRTQFFLQESLVSVLVVDLRNYSGLSVSLGARTTGELMRDLFREATELLRQAGVWSSKFIGDAVMALWQHPDNHMTRADLVIALDVISGFQGVCRTAGRKYELPAPLRFGAGLNAGMASLGNIGGAGTADFTAMGDAVNIAFRLETATKTRGCDLLIARSIFESLSGGAPPPPGLVELALKGADAPVAALPLGFDDLPAFHAWLTQGERPG